MSDSQCQLQGMAGGTNTTFEAIGAHDDQPVVALDRQMSERSQDQSVMRGISRRVTKLHFEDESLDQQMCPQSSVVLQGLGINVHQSKSQGLGAIQKSHSQVDSEMPDVVNVVKAKRSRKVELEPAPELKRKASDEEPSSLDLPIVNRSPEQMKKTRDLVDLIRQGAKAKEEIKKQNPNIDISSIKVRVKGFQSINYDERNFSGFDPDDNISPQKFKDSISGSFGNTIHYKDRRTGMEFRIKRMAGEVSNNEVEVPLTFQCPYILKVAAFGYDGLHSYLAMQDAGHSLKEVCQDEVKWQKLIQSHCVSGFMHDILMAFDVLHRAGIKHCDVKAENTCLKWSERLQRYIGILIDFGSSQTSYDAPSYKGITGECLPPSFNAWYYAAAQCQKMKQPLPPRRELGTADDIYGAGLLPAFIQHRVHPMIKFITKWDMYPGNFSAEKRMDVLGCIGNLKALERLPDFFLKCPDFPFMEPLLERMLDLDDNRRPSAREALDLLEDLTGSTKAPVAKKLRAIVAPSKLQVPAFKTLTFQADRPRNQPLTQNVIHLKPKTEHGAGVEDRTQNTGGGLHEERMQYDSDVAQASNYGVIDRSEMRKNQSCVTRPVTAVVSRPAARSAKVLVPEDDSIGLPSMDADEHLDLVNSFMANPAPLRVQMQQRPPVLFRPAMVDNRNQTVYMVSGQQNAGMIQGARPQLPVCMMGNSVQPQPRQAAVSPGAAAGLPVGGNVPLLSQLGIGLHEQE